MNIRNIGSKIVNIGTIVLMPGDVVELDNKWENIPAIASLVEHGFLAIEASVAVKPEANADVKVEAKAEAKAEDPEPKTKEEAVEVPERRTKRRGSR